MTLIYGFTSFPFMKRLGRPILAIGQSRDYQDTSLELCKSLHRAQISSLLKYAVKEYF